MIENFKREHHEMKTELDKLTGLNFDHSEVSLIEEWMVEVKKLKRVATELEEKMNTSHVEHVKTFKRFTMLCNVLMRLKKEGCIPPDPSKKAILRRNRLFSLTLLYIM